MILLYFRDDSMTKMSSSQPAPVVGGADNNDSLPRNISGVFVGSSFSQPVDPDNMILASQFSASQMVSKVCTGNFD